MVYYNEIDPFCRAWLRALMRAGEIPEGTIDPRPIQRVTPKDLVGYDQHHFFAGIGGWPLALRLATWPDDRPIWTGSCPCQPFSSSGKRRGFKDERHLWPYWRWLLAHAHGESRPPIVVGEQVASKAGRTWLDAVRADVEDLAFAFGATDLCAAGEGAPHIRQRLFFAAIDADRLADCRSWGRRARRASEARAGAESSRGSRAARELAYASRGGLRINGRTPRQTGHADERESHCERLGLSNAAGLDWTRLSDRREDWQGESLSARAGADRRLGHTDRARRDESADGRRAIGRHESPGAGEDDGERLVHTHDARSQERSESAIRRGAVRIERPSAQPSGAWDGCEWIPCLDGKLRPIEPGTRPLATGVPGRVGKLRGYGNSIVPQVAATFLETVMELLS